MTLATLSEVLQPALKGGYAVAGLDCLGWEDMRAYVNAAEAEDMPVILQAGPICRAHTPLPVLGKMFRWLAESVNVPVVAHLDRGTTFEECLEAMEAGFTSLMFDGSGMALEENIAETARIVRMAHGAGISCEGMMGFAGFSVGEDSTGTDPASAARFAAETNVDAMAISVGNEEQSNFDEGLVAAIDALTNVPLVVHDGAGVSFIENIKLAKNTSICKFNIGKELQMVFGAALRTAVNADPERFDRTVILNETENPVTQAARRVIRALGPQ